MGLFERPGQEAPPYSTEFSAIAPNRVTRVSAFRVTPLQLEATVHVQVVRHPGGVPQPIEVRIPLSWQVAVSGV